LIASYKGKKVFFAFCIKGKIFFGPIDIGNKVFQKFLKKSFAIQKAVVYLHSTNNNKQLKTNNMNNYTKVNPVQINAIHDKQDKKDIKHSLLFVALFIVPVIAAGLLEILKN
jgi:hypothetical protein